MPYSHWRNSELNEHSDPEGNFNDLKAVLIHISGCPFDRLGYITPLCC